MSEGGSRPPVIESSEFWGGLEIFPGEVRKRRRPMISVGLPSNEYDISAEITTWDRWQTEIITRMDRHDPSAIRDLDEVQSIIDQMITSNHKLYKNADADVNISMVKILSSVVGRSWVKLCHEWDIKGGVAAKSRFIDAARSLISACNTPNSPPRVSEFGDSLRELSLNGIRLDDVVLSRKGLVENVLGMLNSSRVVVGCSPPATGKTSLLQLIRNQFDGKSIFLF